MFIIEPGDNPIDLKDQLEKEPQPPEGFVDGTVRLGRQLPDGSIEWYGTMPPFPEGCDEPKRFEIKPGSGKKKTGEVETMESRPDREEIMAKARPMIEAGMSISKTAKELGVPLSTLGTWIKKERIEKQEMETESVKEVTNGKPAGVNPEFEAAFPWPTEQKPLQQQPDNFDKEFDAALAKQLARQEQPDPPGEIMITDVLLAELEQKEQFHTDVGFTTADEDPIPYGLPPTPPLYDIDAVKLELIKTAIEESEARDLPSKVILDLIGQIKDLGVGA